MENEIIILPCGFSAKYKDIFYNNDEFPCPVCIKHDITRQECLNMTKNMLALNEKSYELKKIDYDELMMVFKIYKNDPKHYIDESYDRLKREVDLRREEVKLMLNKKIDDYHDGLLKKIDIERDLKFKDVEERIKQADTFDLNSLNVDTNLDVYSKLDFYEMNNIKIDTGIGFVKKILEDLKEPKLKLGNEDFKCFDIYIKKLFGELYSKEETSIFLNKDEFDDNSRSEATVHLKINNFSLLKDKNHLKVYSKKCYIRNFECYILIRLNFIYGHMGLQFICKSMDKSNKFPENGIKELSLLNKSDSKKDFIKNQAFLYHDDAGHKIIKINEIMNPKNGYYDANEDSITAKAVVKAKFPHRRSLNEFFSD